MSIMERFGWLMEKLIIFVNDVGGEGVEILNKLRGHIYANANLLTDFHTESSLYKLHQLKFQSLLQD